MTHVSQYKSGLSRIYTVNVFLLYFLCISISNVFLLFTQMYLF